MTTSDRQCEICGSADVRFAFTAVDKNRRIDETSFSIFRCGECGTGVTEPRFDTHTLARYYPQEYYSLDSNLRLEAATRPHNIARVRRIQQFVKNGQLLDIGAGTGIFLRTARDFGFDVQGLEISEEAAAFGRATWGLNIRSGNLQETTIAPASCDVVTLGHVYEHLHDPQGAARQLHAILKPNGLIVISVPNFTSLQAMLFRSQWFHLDVPRHLFHYTPTGMRRLLEGACFTVLKINFFSAEHNWAGILGSVMQLSRPGESLPHKLVRKLVGVPVTKALAFLEAALGRGGTFELFARKQ